MPLYEYKCRECGRTTEIIHKVDDDRPRTCEHCGGPLKKLLSAPAIQFKGSGWYVTDYARKSVKAPESPGSAKESEPKSETKAEAGKKDKKTDSSSSKDK